MPVNIAVEGRRVQRVWPYLAGAAVLILGALVAALALRGIRSGSVTDAAPVQLTDFNDSAVSPSLSNDGRMLAFVRGGAFGTVASPGGQVYVKLLPGGSPVQLTREAVAKDHPVFSPDDSRIVYTTFSPPLKWDSWQVPVLGGQPAPFLPNASAVTWLDDRRLLYSTVMAGIHMGLASSTESRAEYRDVYFPGREDGMAHRSASSPDGKSLLVVEMNGGTFLPCRLLPADGSSPGQSVSPPGGQCTSAAWSPDGRWMYFSSNAGGSFHIWRQRYPDGVPEQITFGPTEQEGTAITKDGKYLITSMGLQRSSIWLREGDQERRLTDEGFATQPRMAPSGTRMYYLARTQTSRGQASGELWSVDLNSGERQRVLPGLTMANYSLSHDGGAVVFTSAGTGSGDGIWIAGLDRRSPPRQLLHGTDIRAFYGAPGEIVYMGEDRILYGMKEDGSGIARRSAEPIAYLLTVSPDGRWAVAILPQMKGAETTRLAFVSLRGGKSFTVCNENCGAGPRSFLVAPLFSWSTDGKWLLVNLMYFGRNTARAVLLPYRADAPPETLWPKGLQQQDDILATPGAKAINASLTFPAADAGAYLVARISAQSNLYRVRLPD